MLLVSVIGITACSGEQKSLEVTALSREGIPLSINASKSPEHLSPLQYSLYIFSRFTGIEEYKYRLDSIILPLTELSRLKFTNEELSRKEYRFLFIATPKDNSALQVVNTSLTTPSKGTPWDDIRIITQGDSVSIDNYYEVSDRSTQELLSIDTLHGDLKRIVGQVVFRFFKIGKDIHDSQLINTETVSSIFDRIQSIRIDYENYTEALAFDTQGVPQPIANLSPDHQTITQEITTRLQNYRLKLPQQELALVNDDPAAGGEIRGYCFLPNDRQIRTVITITYYDTTPTCGNTGHNHLKSCYPLDTLTLSIPKKSAPGISVEANTYTVNKAGIRCDRIIDINYQTDMEIETDWY